MSKSDISDLLTPSLSASTQPVAFYSVVAHLLVAWFGGPIGIAAFVAVNLWQAGIIKKYLPIVVIFAVVALAWTVALVASALDGLNLPWIDTEQSLFSQLRMANRVIAVSIFGVFYLICRRYFKASHLAGEPKHSPWIAGGACAIFGMALMLAIRIHLQ